MNICKKISKYDYVSFDIFDTLIKRNFSEPKDIFKYIEINFKVDDFYNKRIEAERNLRLRAKEEISLNDIYDELKKNYDEKNINLDYVKKVEIETEINCCVLNKSIYNIYKYCRENKKKIIITSDMYLPIEVIKLILEKNNIYFDEIFLSSDIGLTKKSGNLYRYILESLKINGKQLIHIGDNFKSDYLNAKKSKISSIKISQHKIDIKHFDNISNLDEKILKYTINNQIDKKNGYFYNCGYSIMGPLLLCFCLWLKEKVKNDKISKLLFLSRDGLIIKKAYDKLFKEANTEYFYASRRALIIPSLKYYNSIEAMMNNMFLEKNVTIKSLIKALGLNFNDKNIKKIIKNYEVHLEDIINTEKLFASHSKYSYFFNELYEMVVKESKVENIAFLKYFNEILGNDKNKVGIVDIGWFGNMQNALEKILSNEKEAIEIYGYYVGLVPDNNNQDRYNMCGFLFDKYHSCDLHKYEKRFNAVFETMFLASHGSLKKYFLDNNKVKLQFSKYENLNKVDCLKDFQNGALEFIDFWCKQKLYININNINIFNIINHFGSSPNYEDVINWGNLKFESGVYENYIAKPRSILYYMLKPNKLIKDFNECFWKIGFLKRILRVNINYDNFYNILRK